MSFDDSWYGMRRHRGERSVFRPGEGFSYVQSYDAALVERLQAQAPKAVPAVVEAVPVAPEPSAADKAKAFLVEALTPDPVASLELQARAKAVGIAWRTIRRVAEAVGVRVFKRGRGEWMRGLKDDQPDDGQE
jgi:hypothetical protein